MAMIIKSMDTVLNKTSATWWSAKPSKERCRNSLGMMITRAAEIMPTQRLNSSLPMK